MPPALTDAVLDWAPSGWRELPWRRTRDPWAVLVSEVMLQQTQVARVIPRWTSFLTAWPTPATCAAASQADVVRAWAGLGYNRRAINLHRCAIAIGDSFPDTLEGLIALPGIGPYTARAVLAFAFEADVAVVDTNVERVLRRALGDASQRTADALVPSGRAWEWNQAMLDLGATVCTARKPACDVCPVACGWRPREEPVRRQSRFEGSDRQGRGRLLDALRAGPIADVAAGCGWPSDPARAASVADALVREGFACWRGERLELRRS